MTAASGAAQQEFQDTPLQHGEIENIIIVCKSLSQRVYSFSPSRPVGNPEKLAFSFQGMKKVLIFSGGCL